jgi:hypothetical protein
MSEFGPNENSEFAEKGKLKEEHENSATDGISEDAALVLLKDCGVSAESLVLLARTPLAAKSRKVKLGLVQHIRTPRHVSISLLRRMFTFDLVQVTLTPSIAADIQRAAEEQLLVRLESLPLGQKITLARRSSGRVAAELLRDSEARVISPALDNPKLTEVLIARAISKPGAPELLFSLVSGHDKWSQRREIQIALLRSEKTPLHWACQFVRHFPDDFLREILPETRRDMLAGMDGDERR